MEDHGSTVRIVAAGGEAFGLLRGDMLVTALHVLAERRTALLRLGGAGAGRRRIARRILRSPESDLVLLRIEAGRAPPPGGRPLELRRRAAPRAIAGYSFRTLAGALVRPARPVRLCPLPFAVAPGMSGLPVTRGRRLIGLVHGVALHSGQPLMVWTSLAARSALARRL